METLGPTELLIILAIVLLVFGSARLPKLARSLGEAAHEFRRGTHHEPDADSPDAGAAGAPAANAPPLAGNDEPDGSEPETR